MKNLTKESSINKVRIVLFQTALWIPLITVVGGFLFCIIWESQCRYMFPYYIFVIIYVAVGMGKTAGRICWRILRISEKIKLRTKMSKDNHK